MQKKLPTFGIGPIVVAVMLITSSLGLTLSRMEFIKNSFNEALIKPFSALGIIFIFYGAYIYYEALFKAKIDKGLKETKLVTTGIYSHTRNPIYTAFFFISIAINLFSFNYWCLLIILFNYLFLTILLILTEEKWLKETFQDEYLAYKKEVPRIIPIYKIKRKTP